MGKKLHCLKDIDASSATATCLNCGTVDIYEANKGGGIVRWACKAAKIDTDRRARTRTHDAAKRRRYHRDYSLRREYGITIDDFDAMLASQGGCCACCGRQDSGIVGKDFCVDHDHRTGKVRGVLCNLCNTGLGAFKDDISQLTLAIKYLENHL